MPVYRGGRGHWQAAKRLRRGVLPVAARNDDESILWYTHGPKHYYTSGALFYRDYLIYGWWPWRMPWLFTAFWCGNASFVYLFVYGFVPDGTISDLHVALITLVIAVFGFWHGFTHFRFRKYIVFDRKHKLVHLPRLFGRGLDTVRWEDLGACIVNTIGGYAGSTTMGGLFLCRPRWDLLRDGYPPCTRRIYVYGLGPRYGGPRAVERIWRFIVDFMTQPPAQSKIGDYSDMASTVERDCGGDWDVFFREVWPRRSREPKGVLKHFDPGHYPTAPNWSRTPEGVWQRVGPAEGG